MSKSSGGTRKGAASFSGKDISSTISQVEKLLSTRLELPKYSHVNDTLESLSKEVSTRLSNVLSIIPKIDLTNPRNRQSIKDVLMSISNDASKKLYYPTLMVTRFSGTKYGMTKAEERDYDKMVDVNDKVTKLLRTLSTKL